MSNKLNIGYNIKRFFLNIFFRNKTKMIVGEIDDGIENDEISSVHSDFISKVTSNVRDVDISPKDILAKKIINGNIECYDLTDEETEIMIEYFSNDIKQKESELEKIKNDIIYMKKKISNTN